MLKRDFTKSNKEYFKTNKITLIALIVFLVAGMLVFAIFGMNGNFEVNGYTEFRVTVGESATKEFSDHQQDIGKIINSFEGKFDNVSISGEGDDTQYIVRYLKDVNGNEQIEINKLVAEKLGVNLDDVSEHTKVNSIVKDTDYIYTATAILLLILICTIFAYARYNGASALSVMLSCIIGTMLFMSFTSILRLSIGMSYFAMLVLLNMLIAYFAITIFENMHKSSWLVSGDYSKAMESALKTSGFRMSVISVAIMLIGVLFVLLTSSTIKYVAVNLMFMAVVLLFVGYYIVPFFWNIFITLCRKRNYKIKTEEVDAKQN